MSTLNTPNITFPTSEPSFSTNIQNITISGTYDIGIDSIIVNQSSGGVTLNGFGGWSYSANLLEGENKFVVQSVKGSAFSGADFLAVIYDSNLITDFEDIVPNGIKIRQQRDSIKISVPSSQNADFIGFNFYGAEDIGGGSTGFTLLNQSPVNIVDYFEDNKTTLNEEVTQVGNIVTTVTQQKVERISYISYTHNRQTQALGIKPITEKNHYVVTSVFFDPINKQLVESSYSEELAAKPVVIDTQIKQIDQRTEGDFRVSIIDQILQADSTLDVKPGTVLRDTFVDPASTLFSRMFTILRFMNTAQSFSTLLSFDDPNNTGSSSPVLTTPEKNSLRQAILIPEDQASLVQDLIDAAFDKLASNVNKTRLPASQATGEITVYTKRIPEKDSIVQAGSICETLPDNINRVPSIRFEVLSGFTLRLSELSRYYNPTSQRYEFKLNIRALDSGDLGNVDAGKIVTAVSGFDSIFGIVNSVPTEFGQDRESNSSLATRSLLAFLSVDSGTEAGYFSNTIGIKGVTRAKIIKAKDPLMQRDLDPLREIHTYGKVDIYVQGIQNRTVTESFGFSYRKIQNELFYIQSRPFMQFRATNSDVSPEYPIFQVIEVRNVTKNNVYDLTNIAISNDGNLIDLDESLETNQLIGLSITDVIRVTYIYRKSDNVRFLTQPVEKILSVTGSKSGELSPENYTLIRQDDPLLLGRSTSARDEIRFNFANGIPNAQKEVIAGEPLVLVGIFPQALSQVDVDLTTLEVKDVSNVLYVLNLDYEIIPGDNRTPPQIKRTTNGNIPDGSIVYLSYEAGEIMTVEYQVNDILTEVQEVIDEMRHLTADVVIKAAQPTFIDMDITVVLESGADTIRVDRNIRTNIGNFLANTKLGQNIYQSDIISIMENTNGVDYVVVPASKMVKTDVTQVIREVLANPQFEIYQVGSVTSYRSIQKLASKTLENGGPENEFRGIFENDFLLNMKKTDVEVSNEAGAGYISADGTIIVSTRNGNNPNANKYTVTYLAIGETGAKDIILSSVEYGQIGTLNITYANNGLTISG
jgi:hypothetical protein